MSAAPMSSGATPRSPSLLLAAPVEELLPGEEGSRRCSQPVLLVRLVQRVATSLLLALVSAPLWPVYLALATWHGWPPNVPRRWQVARYLRHTWTAQLPPPGLGMLNRVWLTLSIVRHCLTVPLLGVGWILDELLYARELRDHPVVAPLFEMSAARSGSTQLARYLEEDPHLAAPPFLACVVPSLWLWRLLACTVGRIVPQESIRRAVEASLTHDFLQRHEVDPFRTDTFDVVLFGAHLNHLSLHLGPDVIAEDFAFGPYAPHNRELWERDFVDLLDGIGRRTLAFQGPAPDGSPRRLFVKGHFLAAADALARRYPDACFLTVLREPAPRLRSVVNFYRVNPIARAIGRPPWAWLGAAVAEMEPRYCEREQDWFTREHGPRRCVVRFADYVRDLEGTLTRIYAECLDTSPLPAYAPRVHTPRERGSYLVDRPLSAVGIDENALEERLAGYIAWCRGVAP